MIRLALLISALCSPVAAETVVAARTIRAQTILTPEDLALIETDIPGMVRALSGAIGQEARVALYSGRPIGPADIGPAAIIERNQIVPLIYEHGGLVISAEGRALDRAGAGEMVRVINTTSRKTVFGHVAVDGSVHIIAAETTP